MPAPWLFTFYSYKGGVGRSQAAANVAYTLAGWGRHVLLADMDLEAPGLSGFLGRTRELASPQTTREPDILWLLEEIVVAHRRGSDPERAVSDLPPVSTYVRPVSPEKLQPLAPKMGQLGRLDVLVADQGANYTERLAALGLHDLGHEGLVSVSGLLHRYFKGQRFQHRPFWLESYQPSVSTPYDYVIVDSRTGLSEIGGLCVGPLADRLVVVTGLNDQNVEGTRAFLEEVGIKPEARPKDYARWDEDDKPGDKASLGPKPTIIVASPVPAGEIEAKRVRLLEIEKRLGMVPEQIAYHPQIALKESLFVRDYREEYLTSQYHRLTDRIQSQVGDDEGTLVAELNTLLRRQDAGTDWARAVGLALRLAPMSSVAPSFVSYLANAIGASDHLLVLPLYALLSHESPTNAHALNNWGLALYERAKANQGLEADRLFASACDKFGEATRAQPGLAAALYNWGNVLFDQAKTKRGESADRLLASASEKYAEAVRLKPDYADALSNWGAALLNQATNRRRASSDTGASHDLLDLPRLKLLEARERGSQSSPYNLACLEAIRGNSNESVSWLRTAAEAGHPVTQAVLSSDTDFDSIRQDPAFVEFLSGLPEK
jgi:hypothetical protein